jgi:Rrf2 family protein
MKRLASPHKTKFVSFPNRETGRKMQGVILAKSDLGVQYLRAEAAAMFSRSAGYSIQALTYLAAQPSGKLTGAREIAAASRVPMPFLWKLLRNLSQQKLLRSFKGVHGGYELARPAQKITIGEILAATPDSGLMDACVLGLGQCDEHNPCPLHTAWQTLRGEIETFLKRTTLADLARESRKSVRKRSHSGARNRSPRS